jgi:hypothetical protein
MNVGIVPVPRSNVRLLTPDGAALDGKSQMLNQLSREAISDGIPMNKAIGSIS